MDGRSGDDAEEVKHSKPLKASPFDANSVDTNKGVNKGEVLEGGSSKMNGTPNFDEPLPFRENPMYTKAPFIIIMELCERLAYYGMFRVYTFHPLLPPSLPGLNSLLHPHPVTTYTFIRNCHQHHHLPYIRVGVFPQNNTKWPPFSPTFNTHPLPPFSTHIHTDWATPTPQHPASSPYGAAAAT